VTNLRSLITAVADFPVLGIIPGIRQDMVRSGGLVTANTLGPVIGFVVLRDVADMIRNIEFVAANLTLMPVLIAFRLPFVADFVFADILLFRVAGQAKGKREL
jgi:hypothetical protein